MRACIREMGIRDPTLTDLDVVEVLGLGLNWPAVNSVRNALSRLEAAEHDRQRVPVLSRLVGRAKSAANPRDEWDSYLALLDRALEDRRITQAEAEELSVLAREAGLTQSDIAGAHLQYLKELVNVAWKDGKVTDAERRDIAEVARLLCVDEDMRDALIELSAEANKREAAIEQLLSDEVAVENIVGRTVCFTGAFQCRIAGEAVSRERACELAIECQMLVKKNVSRKLDYLVVADPDSLSSKARKARELGVRILAEQVFWRMLGYDVE